MKSNALIWIGLAAATAAAIYFATRKPATATAQDTQAPAFSDGAGSSSDSGSSYAPTFADKVRATVQPPPAGTKISETIKRSTEPRTITSAEKTILESAGVKLSDSTVSSPTRTAVNGLFGTHI